MPRPGSRATLLGQVSASWNDTSGTGKFRLPAIENFIEHNDAECIVTLNADVRGIVDLVYSVGVGIASYSGKVQLFNQVLWSVSTGPCPDTETAHVSSGGEALPASDAFPNGETSTPGELIVNAGPFACLRESGATDTDENFMVMQLAAGVFQVNGMGLSNTYSGVSSIFFDGGAGNNSIMLQGVTVPATLIGGDPATTRSTATRWAAIRVLNTSTAGRGTTSLPPVR